MPSPVTSLTPESPFYLRLNAYLKERFPVLGHGVLVVCYYSSNHFLANALTNSGAVVRFSIGSLMGVVTLFCFFLHLRVFDEHKDYVEDDRYHAGRVLQRGLVTLRHLKMLGGAAIGLELLFGALRGPAALVSLLAALVFSLLMLREFFVRDWLKRHFLLYALSHMLVMPLLAAVVYSFATGRHFWEAPSWYWLYAAAGFFVGFGWEISRKIRAPEEEIDGVDSYTKVLGTHGAAYVLLLIRTADVGLAILVGRHLGIGTWFFIVLAALLGVCVMSVVHYRLRTSRKTAKRMAGYAALHLVVSNLAMAAAIASQCGVAWGTLW